MKQLLVFMLFVGIFQNDLIAQKQSKLKKKEAVIYQPIAALFDGMREGNATKASDAFIEEATLQSYFKNKKGETVIHTESISNFIKAIGQPHDEIWDERIYKIKVHEMGKLAQVITEYQFYVGDKFSHCGVNAFNLVKINGQWKIAQIIDTRRVKGCK